MSYESFFNPFSYKKLHLRNRFVMAPMTRSFSPNGVPSAEVANYYGRRAAADVGLILTEGTVIDRLASKNQKDIPNFHGAEALKGWETVVEAVHKNHGAIAPQIWHVGNSPSGEWRPAAPFEGPENMSAEDIEDAIQQYANSARHAKDLGFDALELHGAHGYLIDQFLWDRTNTRKDEYGGKTLKARTRFGTDVVRAVRNAVGDEMTIIIRLSQFKGQDFAAKMASTQAEIEEWVLPFAEAGVDIFHASQRRYWEPIVEGSDLNLAGWFKKVSGKPTITVGSVGLTGDMTQLFTKGEGSPKADLTELVRRFDRGDFDLVAVGRALLQDHLWVQKLQQKKFDELKDFDSASVGKLF